MYKELWGLIVSKYMRISRSGREIPTLGKTGIEILDNFLKLECSSVALPVLTVLGEATYSNHENMLHRTFSCNPKKGRLATYRKATEAEYTSVLHDIEKGCVEISYQSPGGVSSTQWNKGYNKILHQATGRKLELEFEKIEE